MARWKPAPVIGGAYSDDAKAWSCQDTVNYIPVLAEREGGRSPSMLRGAPGFSVFSILGTNAPIRGLHNVEGLLLAVSGNKLFKIAADSAVTEIGTIPGVERVSMAHNQIAGGNEVAIANGQSGYVYNTYTGTLAQITDEGFPGAISFDFCDGFIMGIEPGRRFAFTSDLNAATSYNTIDRYEAEGSPDKLVGQIVTHREWWLFGERTIEPYTNTGAATGTFQRSSGTVIEIGAASRYAICQMDNSVFWLGDDGVVYRANGYTPQRISTHAIEQAISRCNIAQSFAFTFEDEGHKVYYLTFPDGHTWGYDAASGEWHRRQSYGLDRWRINALVRWNGVWIAGDYSNGRLYQLDWVVQNEARAVLERRRITGVLSDNQNPVNVNAVALVFDTGAAIAPKPFLPPLKIAGQLPDAAVSDVVSYQYTIRGGVLPLGDVTVSSGALPDGLTMSVTGLVTGVPTTEGVYTWEVTGADAADNPATLLQTATIGIVATWDVVANHSPNALFDATLRKLVGWSATIGSTARSMNGHASGKWQAEFQCLSAGNNSHLYGITDQGTFTDSQRLGIDTANDSIAVGNSTSQVWNNKSFVASASVPVWNAGTPVIGVCIDMTANTVKFFVDGVLSATQTIPSGKTWYFAATHDAKLLYPISLTTKQSGFQYPIAGYVGES
jgi:hypothetical protein